MAPRPSNAGRWIPCPASYALESHFPETDDSDAQEGVAAHWAAAQDLGGYISLAELVDRQAPNGVVITGDMVDHVALYVETVRAVVPLPVVEKTLEICEGVEPGTPDARAVIGGNRGVIFDEKYGWGIVEANAWQLLLYAIGLFRAHPELIDVTCYVVQPRPYHPMGRVRSITYSADQLRYYTEVVKAAAARTQDPNAPMTTGAHCKDCRALHVCDAARRAGLNAIDVTTAPLVVDLPPAELAYELMTLDRAYLAIKSRRDAIEAHAFALIDAGGAVPGYSVEKSFGRRRLNDDADAALLEAMTGLDLHERKPVNPAEMERRGVPKQLVKQFTRTPETGRKLVAVDSSLIAAKVFNNVTR